MHDQFQAVSSLPLAAGVPAATQARARQELLAVQKGALLPLAQALLKYTAVCSMCSVEPLVQDEQWRVCLRPAWLAPDKQAREGAGAVQQPAAKRPRT